MKKKGKTRKDDVLITWMQQWFSKWMAKDEDFRAADLMEALGGNDFLTFGYEDDPYLWIWRGMPPKGRARAKALDLLVQAAKIILAARPPELVPVWRFKDKMQYNLFSLCALLKSYDLLSPLQQLRKHIKLIRRSSTRQEVIDVFWEALKASFLDMICRDKGQEYHDECARILAMTRGDFDECTVFNTARLFVSEKALHTLAVMNTMPLNGAVP